MKPEDFQTVGIVGVLILLILKEVFTFVKGKAGSKTDWQIAEMYEKDSETRKVMHKIAASQETQTEILKNQTVILGEIKDKIRERV